MTALRHEFLHKKNAEPSADVRFILNFSEKCVIIGLKTEFDEGYFDVPLGAEVLDAAVSVDDLYCFARKDAFAW